MTPNVAKFIYVEDGLRLDKPIDVSEYPVQFNEPIVPEYGSRSRKGEGSK